MNLKSCPFCGSTELDIDGHRVACYACRCEGPYLPMPDREEAERRWNRRASPWHPASEVPPMQGFYAVLLTASWDRAFYTVDCEWRDSSDNDITAHVTHWMEIPPCP